MRRLLLAVVLVFMLPIVSSAATYYIDDSGNDTTGDGSIGNPWATLEKFGLFSLVAT